MRVLLYSKPDCHLCDLVKADLADLAAIFTFDLVVQDIQADEDLFQRFRYLIPVVDVAGGPLLYAPISRTALEQALAAASHAPTSPAGSAQP